MPDGRYIQYIQLLRTSSKFDIKKIQKAKRNENDKQTERQVKPK